MENSVKIIVSGSPYVFKAMLDLQVEDGVYYLSSSYVKRVKEGEYLVNIKGPVVKFAKGDFKVPVARTQEGLEVSLSTVVFNKYTILDEGEVTEYKQEDGWYLISVQEEEYQESYEDFHVEDIANFLCELYLMEETPTSKERFMFLLKIWKKKMYELYDPYNIPHLEGVLLEVKQEIKEAREEKREKNLQDLSEIGWEIYINTKIEKILENIIKKKQDEDLFSTMSKQALCELVIKEEKAGNTDRALEIQAYIQKKE